MASVVGVSPLTLVTRGEGYPPHPVWAGHPVPDDADPDQVALLIEEGHLADLDGPQPEPLVELGPQDLPVPPAKNASREAWEAYLHVIGHEDTEGLTRNELRDLVYGGPDPSQDVPPPQDAP